jgi:hypothetical protein
MSVLIQGNDLYDGLALRDTGALIGASLRCARAGGRESDLSAEQA